VGLTRDNASARTGNIANIVAAGRDCRFINEIAESCRSNCKDGVLRSVRLQKTTSSRRQLSLRKQL